MASVDAYEKRGNACLRVPPVGTAPLRIYPEMVITGGSDVITTWETA